MEGAREDRGEDGSQVGMEGGREDRGEDGSQVGMEGGSEGAREDRGEDGSQVGMEGGRGRTEVKMAPRWVWREGGSEGGQG